MSDSELVAIIERNKRVDADKAWETSWARRLTITVMTYIIATIYMKTAGFDNSFTGAFVPSGGYLLSTLSLPFIKKTWLNNFYKKQD